MIKSEMFKEAHKGASQDVVFDATLPARMRHNHAYYFRLHLRNLYANERDSRAKLMRGFQIIEPRVLWA